jgi:hypothetical protein
MTITALDLLGHAAETGGGPRGFGWASFATFTIGTGVVVYSAGQLVKVVHARRIRPASNHESAQSNGSNAPGGTQSATS